MQVAVEESGAIERRVTVSVPGEQVDQEVTRRLKNMAKKVRIPGFRPGKAPWNVISQRYGSQVTDEVVGEVIRSSYRDALGQQELEPAGLLSMDPVPYAAGGDLTYTATVELFPEIPVTTLAGRKIERPVVEITDADVERTLETLRQRAAEFVPRGGPAEEGDRVTMDYTAHVGGEEFSGSTATDYAMILGQGQHDPAYHAALVGAAAGERKTVSLPLPAAHPDRPGAEATFDITVKQVERPELPALDEALAERFGIREGGVEALRREVRTNLVRERDEHLRNTLRAAVMTALVDGNRDQVDLPRSLVAQETERTMAEIDKQLAAAGQETGKLNPENFAETARHQVLVGLIVREVFRRPDDGIDPAAVRARLEAMADTYDEPEKFIAWHYESPERMQQVEAQVHEDQVIAALLATAKVTDRRMSFQEFAQTPPPGSTGAAAS